MAGGEDLEELGFGTERNESGLQLAFLNLSPTEI